MNFIKLPVILDSYAAAIKTKTQHIVIDLDQLQAIEANEGEDGTFIVVLYMVRFNLRIQLTPETYSTLLLKLPGYFQN